MTALGLYIHVPFCLSRCGYCHFFSLSGADQETQERYVRHVCDEIRIKAGGEHVDTIYLGGGTPSLLDPGQVSRILETAADEFRITSDAEISLEANPESLDAGKLRSLRAAGVNRISVGVQAMDDDTLKRLGRAHSAGRARLAITQARDSGFENVSADLMFGLPGQDLPQWRAGLEEALRLPLTHLSCYELTLDPGSAFAARTPVPPGEDEAADEWELLIDLASRAGLEHYEVSNYARPGFSCRHNLKYWRDTDFLGFGAGAWGARGDVRTANPADLALYFAGAEKMYPPAEESQPGPSVRMAETLMLNLRLRKGCVEKEFIARYGPRALDPFAAPLAAHAAAGRVERSEGRLYLTHAGLLLANEVWADLLEAAKL